MVPRIVVPDKGDQSTVVTALVMYSHSVAARAMMDGDFSHMIDEQKRIVGLLEALREEVIGERAERVFGPMPDDDEIKSAFDRFREEFGD